MSLLAVAYYEPLTATDRTCELTMIGVRRDLHRQGRGAELLQHVEDDLRFREQRLLVIETSLAHKTGHDLTGFGRMMAT